MKMPALKCRSKSMAFGCRAYSMISSAWGDPALGGLSYFRFPGHGALAFGVHIKKIKIHSGNLVQYEMQAIVAFGHGYMLGVVAVHNEDALHR